jgi:ribosomal protein L30E
LARKAGAAVGGFEKARGVLKSGAARLLITARDGAAVGHRKLEALASGVARASGLDGLELGAVFGRSKSVHVAITDRALAQRIAFTLGRLEGLRG